MGETGKAANESASTTWGLTQRDATNIHAVIMPADDKVNLLIGILIDISILIMLYAHNKPKSLYNC